MRLWVLPATAALAAAGAAALAGDPPSAGERAFQKCYACHSLGAPDPSLQGPSLKGIVGRQVAAEPGFAYSPAMRAYAGRQPRWTREALSGFITDPQAVAPGNDMGFFGIADAAERRALIEYLAGG